MHDIFWLKELRWDQMMTEYSVECGVIHKLRCQKWRTDYFPKDNVYHSFSFWHSHFSGQILLISARHIFSEEESSLLSCRLWQLNGLREISKHKISNKKHLSHKSLDAHNRWFGQIWLILPFRFNEFVFFFICVMSNLLA